MNITDAVKKTFSSLRNRNFRLYFTGQIVSNTGNWLTNVALTLLVFKLTHSGLDVGLMAACQFGPILLLSAYGGAVADRVDKRRALLLTQSLEMSQSIGLAIMAFLPHPPLAGLYILAAFGGVFLAFDNPLRRSFVSEMVPPEDVPNAVVLYSTIVNVSRVFGPALAGLLVVTLGYGWAFGIDAATYVAVLICLAMMRPAELFRRPPKARAKGEVKEGFLYVLAQPALLISFVMLAIVGVLSYNFTVTLPLFVLNSLHGTNGTFTILYSIFSLGAVISGLIVAQRNLVKLRHIILAAVGQGVAMLLLSISPNIAVAAPVIFLIGMASVIYTTSTTTMVQLQTKPEMVGRVLALQMILLIGTTPIGGPIMGWLADLTSARVPIVVGGVASLAAAGYGYWASQKTQDAL